MTLTRLAATLSVALVCASPAAAAPPPASDAPALALPSGARVQVPGPLAAWEAGELRDGATHWDRVIRTGPGPALDVALQRRGGPTLCRLALSPYALLIDTARQVPAPPLPPGWHPLAVVVPLASGARLFACADLPDGILMAVITTAAPDVEAVTREVQPILSSYARHMLWGDLPVPAAPRVQVLAVSGVQATLPEDWHYEARPAQDVLHRRKVGAPALVIGVRREAWTCEGWARSHEVDPKPDRRRVARPAWLGGPWADAALETPEPRGNTLALCRDLPGGDQRIVATVQYGGRFEDPDLAEASKILSTLAPPPGPARGARRPRPRR